MAALQLPMAYILDMIYSLWNRKGISYTNLNGQNIYVYRVLYRLEKELKEKTSLQNSGEREEKDNGPGGVLKAGPFTSSFLEFKKREVE